MKELFKAQMSYFRFHYFFSWGFALILAVVLLLTGIESAYFVTMGGSIFVIILFSVLMGVKSDQEKRDRLFVLLPRKLSEIIITQIMLILLLFGGIVVICCITYMIQPRGNFSEAIIQVASLCFYLINWIFFFRIWGHLTHVGKYYLKIIFLFFVIIYNLLSVIIGFYFGISVFAWLSFSDTSPETLPEFLSTAILSVILIITEYMVFLQRKTYLT